MIPESLIVAAACIALSRVRKEGFDFFISIVKRLSKLGDI
jgi:hypothetical protein